MSRKAVTGWREGALMVGATAALLGIGGFYSTLAIILVAGVIGWWWFRAPKLGAGGGKGRVRRAPVPKAGMSANLLLFQGSMVASLLSFEPALTLKLLLVFAGMSVMLFGGGYVFIPLIQEIVVDGHHWVTTQEFIDAIAMGQITPGPILVSAAFIGLKVAGFAGAIAATIGIYLPPALLMVASTRLLEIIKKSQAIRAALRGIRPAVVGMIVAAAFVVGKTALPVWVSVAIFAGALYALLRFRLEAVWIIPASGLLGLALY
jgi:chromate transporter